MVIAAILWDMDGVLIDSEPLKYESWRRAIEYNGGKKFEKADYSKLIGFGSNEIVSILHRQGLIEKDVAELVLRDRNQIYDAISMQDVKPIAASVNLLKKIHSKRVNALPWQAAVSAESSKNIEIHLDKFNLHPYLLFAISTEGMKSKPFPDGYLAALKRLKIDAKKAIAIEDTPAGVEAAIRAGLKVIGLSSQYVDEARLEKAGANLVVPSLSDLREDFYKQF